MTKTPNAGGPLQGLRVLELAAIGPAPFCGALLGDMGADVLRIDRPLVAGAVPEPPPAYDFYNRNKRSRVLDLKRPADHARLLELVQRADVLLEGLRPGVLERLGLAPERLLALNPRLVIGRMTGWGQAGPLAMEAGHDITYLALTGALHAIGAADRPPSPPLNLVADLGGGAMYLAVGVLAALTHARATGQGQVVDAAMVDGVTHLMSAFQAFQQRGLWADARGCNLVDGGAPYYGCYECLDGRYVAVGAMEPPFYASLLSVMGLDAHTLPPQDERSAWPAMRERFAAVFRTRTRDDWVAAAASRDACLAPVLTIAEAPEHPHLRARGAYQMLEGVRHPSPAPRFSRTPSALRRGAPAAGEQGDQALADWGLP